ncbi:hypothetical protein K2X40_01205 [Candidatus Babeliales bacterium]|nr:hypothetical protein [Candidatus Babeliales bacterium]
MKKQYFFVPIFFLIFSSLHSAANNSLDDLRHTLEVLKAKQVVLAQQLNMLIYATPPLTSSTPIISTPTPLMPITGTSFEEDFTALKAHIAALQTNPGLTQLDINAVKNQLALLQQQLVALKNAQEAQFEDLESSATDVNSLNAVYRDWVDPYDTPLNTALVADAQNVTTIQQKRDAFFAVLTQVKSGFYDSQSAAIRQFCKDTFAIMLHEYRTFREMGVESGPKGGGATVGGVQDGLDSFVPKHGNNGASSSLMPEYQALGLQDYTDWFTVVRTQQDLKDNPAVLAHAKDRLIDFLPNDGKVTFNYMDPMDPNVNKLRQAVDLFKYLIEQDILNTQEAYDEIIKKLTYRRPSLISAYSLLNAGGSEPSLLVWALNAILYYIGQSVSYVAPSKYLSYKILEYVKGNGSALSDLLDACCKYSHAEQMAKSGQPAAGKFLNARYDAVGAQVQRHMFIMITTRMLLTAINERAGAKIVEEEQDIDDADDKLKELEEQLTKSLLPVPTPPSSSTSQPTLPPAPPAETPSKKAVKFFDKTSGINQSAAKIPTVPTKNNASALDGFIRTRLVPGQANVYAAKGVIPAQFALATGALGYDPVGWVCELGSKKKGSQSYIYDFYKEMLITGAKMTYKDADGVLQTKHLSKVEAKGLRNAMTESSLHLAFGVMASQAIEILSWKNDPAREHKYAQFMKALSPELLLGDAQKAGVNVFDLIQHYQKPEAKGLMVFTGLRAGLKNKKFLKMVIEFLDKPGAGPNNQALARDCAALLNLYIQNGYLSPKKIGSLGVVMAKYSSGSGAASSS